MHVVLAEPIALIAGVDDERVVEGALGAELVDHTLDVVVNGGDAADVFVDEMLVGERTTLSRVVGLFSNEVLVHEVKTFRPFLIVHDGEMFALEQGLVLVMSSCRLGGSGILTPSCSLAQRSG